MDAPRDTDDSIARDLRRASLKWLERFFLMLLVMLAVWYLLGWWALIPGTFAVLILVRSINTARMAKQLDDAR